MKKTYVFSSGIIMLVPLVLLFIPLIGLFVMPFYLAPLGVIGGLFGSTEKFIVMEMFSIFPTVTGWLILIPFWFVIGLLVGYILYLFRKSIYSRKNLEVPPPNTLSILLTLLIQTLIIFTLSYAIVPFTQKEEAQREGEKQKYYVDNCSTVYTKKHNYKVLVCPDSIVADSSDASIEYLSEKRQESKQ